MLECVECSKKESVETKQKCFSTSRCLVCQNQLAFIPQLPLDVAHRLRKDTELPKENSSQKKHNTAMPGTSSVYRDLLKQFNMICKYLYFHYFVKGFLTFLQLQKRIRQEVRCHCRLVQINHIQQISTEYKQNVLSWICSIVAENFRTSDYKTYSRHSCLDSRYLHQKSPFRSCMFTSALLRVVLLDDTGHLLSLSLQQFLSII